MEKVIINVDDITTKLANTFLSTLEKAAEISPFIKERTIGPDLEPWEQRSSKAKDKEINDNNENQNKKEQRIVRAKSEPPKTPKKFTIITQTPKSCESYRNKTHLNSSIMNLSSVDPDLLEETVCIKENQTRRLKAFRKEFIEKQTKGLNDSLSHLEADKMAIKEEFEQRSQALSTISKEIERQAQEHIQKSLQNERDLLEEQRKQKDKCIQMLVLKAIWRYQVKFRSIYESLTKILIAGSKESMPSCQEHNKNLKELVGAFESIIARVRNTPASSKDLVASEKLCLQLMALEKSVMSDLNIVKKQNSDLQAAVQMKEKELEQQKKLMEMQKLQQQQQLKAQQDLMEQQRLQLEQEEKQKQELEASQPKNEENPLETFQEGQSVTDKGPSSEPINPSRMELYEAVMGFYKQKLANVKPFQNDEGWNKYRHTCLRIVNTPINAISNIGGDFIKDKYEKIVKFLNGNPQKTSLGDITINDHSLARDCCTLLMGKTFVSKGYLEISSNPFIAFPVASVIVSLWKLYPEFGTIYLAQTFKLSPLLVPIYIPKKPEQSHEEYLVSMGYLVGKDGKLEEENVFLKKQTGIARLYAAVMINQGKQSDHDKPHPWGIEQGYLWLVHFLQIEPFPSLSANTLLEMLQILSADLMAAYGKQFLKILLYIQQYYMPKLNQIDQGGPKARLEMLLETYLKEGIIQKPQGALTPNFW